MRTVSAAADALAQRLLFLVPVVGFDLKMVDAAQSGHLWPDLSPFVPLQLLSTDLLPLKEFGSLLPPRDRG